MGFRPAPRSGLATKGVRELERESHQSLLPALPSPEAARWSDSITHKLSGTARTRSNGGEREWLDKLPSHGIPFFVLIDSSGRVVFPHAGLDEKGLRAALASLWPSSSATSR
jgi:hypothetical protein